MIGWGAHQQHDQNIVSQHCIFCDNFFLCSFFNSFMFVDNSGQFGTAGSVVTALPGPPGPPGPPGSPGRPGNSTQHQHRVINTTYLSALFFKASHI